jgi:hypothetical protein
MIDWERTGRPGDLSCKELGSHPRGQSQNANAWRLRGEALQSCSLGLNPCLCFSLTVLGEFPYWCFSFLICKMGRLSSSSPTGLLWELNGFMWTMWLDTKILWSVNYCYYWFLLDKSQGQFQGQFKSELRPWVFSLVGGHRSRGCWAVAVLGLWTGQCSSSICMETQVVTVSMDGPSLWAVAKGWMSQKLC